MNSNQLGKNIESLRKMHGETLEELGTIINCAKSTVKGYESGAREPDFQTLENIARHYSITTDELLHTDLTLMTDTDFNFDFNPASIFTIIDIMFPLCCSDSAMKNENFKKGYELSKSLLDGFSRAECFPSNMIPKICDCFLKAAVESKEPEAFANSVWSFFMLWSQITDTDAYLSLNSKFLSNQVSFKDIKAINTSALENKEIQKQRKDFLDEYDPVITSILKALKVHKKWPIEWQMLADFYLAMRYVVGMVDTDLTSEMNTTVGMQMMLSFCLLGNKFAQKLFLTDSFWKGNKDV